MQENWMTAVTFFVAGVAIATTSGMYLSFKSTSKKKLEENYTTSKATQPKGFIDFETGKRVDIDETTHKEVFVGELAN